MTKSKLALIAMAFTLLTGGLAACLSSGGGRPGLDELVFGPIKTDLPKTKRITLSNGMVIHLLPDHELPLFKVSAMIRAGSIWEPPGKTGLAALTGATIRSGGTRSTPPDKLDNILEHISASVETHIGVELGSASLSTMSKDKNFGLKIFADVLRDPRFDKNRFELAKAKMLDSIRRENDSPTQIGLRELKELIYAKTPYAARATIESVQSITRSDVISFYKKYFVPQNIMLGVTGDFDEKEIVAKLNELFGDWTGPETSWPVVTRVEESYTGGVYIAEKKLKQSVIRIGHLAVRRSHPDYHALRVMDEILGGNGFSSRIVKSVRTDRGLAYSVWSYYIGGRWEMGRFLLGAETKASSTAEVIGLIKGEVEKIRAEKVTEEELRLAKNSIVNSFVFIFDRPSRIMSERMTVDYYDMPADYLEGYRKKVMKVTADDVLRVAQKHLRPDGLKIVVVGDPESFDRPLDEFGKIEKLSLRDYSKNN